MPIKLVSFSVCPFVQRAVLVLKEKGVDFDVEYVDLLDKPDWFLKLSPRSKVPLLVVDGGHVLFESHAICEYLDETFPEPRMMPHDPIERANDRAWFTFASEDVFIPLWKMETARTTEDLETARAKARAALERLDAHMRTREWLSGNGTSFGMADVAMAPAFYRMRAFDRLGQPVAEGLDHVRAWGDRILARPEVDRSVPKSWAEDHIAYMTRQEGVMRPGA